MRISRFARNYGAILSGLLAGLGALGGGWIISGGVEEGLEERFADIAIAVQGFNSGNSTDRLVLAHNYGTVPGTLMADVVIVASTDDGTKIDRADVSLNPGLAGGQTMSPFTLHGEEGRRYFLTHRPRLLNGAASCVLEFQVMQPDGNPRKGTSPPFKCDPSPGQ